MKTFIEIINDLNLDGQIISNNSENYICDITLDSRETNHTGIFLALKGFKADGHMYIPDSIKNGCRDFIIENESFVNDEYKKKCTIFKVKHSRKVLGQISNYINDYPYKTLKMIGITGTKGKTTVSTLIHYLLKDKYKTSLFTTVKNIICGNQEDSVRTTMESYKLQKLLKLSKMNGEQVSVVEVSSHAVTLQRIYGIEWDYAIFTSFSRDHLDLYGTMEKYFNSKLDFFKELNKSSKLEKKAFINMNDIKGQEICDILDEKIHIIRIGNKKNYECYIKESFCYENKMFLKIIYKDNEYSFNINGLRGDFNFTNVALAISVAFECGISLSRIEHSLEEFNGIEGRFEIIVSQPFTVIVDYAHTPDSLKKILSEAGKMTNNRLICVFGCTGERDTYKRKIMGKIAAKMCNFSIITNDDTYDEKPEKIVSEIQEGFEEMKKIIDIDYKIILDRKIAIKESLINAKPGDVIVIAGMGHEKVQILNNGIIEHNDKEEVLKVLKNIK